ncbi:hypothetical protein GCM10027425_21820 [Alteromonas gracilis]
MGTSEQRVGDYRLLTRLGEGGMGVVHLGQGPDGRRVAVKVLRQHVIGDREARERLAREVSSLSRVTSPRVAEILDADPHAPTPYVVTRYVPGLSLHEHVREEGVLTGVDLLHGALCLAEALQAVHGVGVLHRDVKPSNVLMEGRSPVLIDFGLARLSEDPRLTQTGFLLGTPGYLAPEVLYGDEATAAADVHAWAATVVFAATGRPPYGKGPTMAVLDRVRLGHFDLDGVPEPLAGLLRECLSPEPLDRPTLHEIVPWLGRQIEQRAPRRTVSDAPITAQIPLTMPLASGARAPRTEVVGAATASPPATPPPVDPGTRVEPVAYAPIGHAPQAASQPPVDTPAGHTRRLGEGDPHATTQLASPVHVPGDGRVHRTQRRALMAGLVGASAGMIAYAPYFGTFLVALVVLALRTVSVTRQRHAVRRIVRGRAKWTDVPRTTLGTPWYAVVALGGTLAAIGWGIGASVAVGLLLYLFGLGVVPGLGVMGVVLTLSLWWGPGSGRLRETTRRLVDRTAQGTWQGWFAVGSLALLTVVLGATLVSQGPDWSPNAGAPWSSGFLAEVLSYI